MPFYFNKDNLPPVLVVFCKEDYHVCSLVSGNRLKFIKKKKPSSKWIEVGWIEQNGAYGPNWTETDRID